MLKTEIVKALMDAFPDENDREARGHAADVIIEIVIKVIGGTIGAAIAAYEEGVQLTSDT